MLKNKLIVLILVLCSCAQIKERREAKKDVDPKDMKAEKKAVEPRDVVVIFGPGGMKVFSQIGVMKALDEENIRPKKVVGLEWGAAVAAVYARKAKVHDLEWQMGKLKAKNLPKEGFFKNNLDLENPNRLNLFFEKVFQAYNLANGEIPFSCPTKTIKMEKPSWLQSGPAYRELKKCLAYPPLFYSYNGWRGDAMAIEEAIEEAKTSPNDYVVLIDVIPGEDFSTSKEILDQEAEKILWQEIRLSLENAKNKVDAYIPVNTSQYHMLEVNQSRELIKKGEREARSKAKQIKEETNGSL